MESGGGLMGRFDVRMAVEGIFSILYIGMAQIRHVYIPEHLAMST